jgi:hypothetical protein
MEPRGKSVNKNRGTPQYSTISLALPNMTVGTPRKEKQRIQSRVYTKYEMA